jgi:serine/threonine protein kinase
MAEDEKGGAGEQLRGLALGSGSRLADLGTIVNPEELPPEQRNIVDRYIRITRDGSFLGVLVGVMRGDSSWDLRPILLDTGAERRGTLHLLRMADPEAFLSGPRKQFFDDTFAAIQRCTEAAQPRAVGAYAWGEAQGQFWIRRKFYQRTLADVLGPDQGAGKDFAAVPFAQRVIAALAALHRAGGVHGHLSPDNIAVDEDHAVLLDYAFTSVVGVRRSASAYLAPEAQPSSPPTTAADIYGLGNVLRRILSESLSSEHREFLDLMSHPDPAKRPALKAVEERFVPSHRNRQSSSKLIGGLPAGKVKSGKLLSNSALAEASAAQAEKVNSPAAGSDNGGSARGAEEKGASEKFDEPRASSRPAAPRKDLMLPLRDLLFRARASLQKVSPRARNSFLGALLLAALVGVGAAWWEPHEARVARFQELWSSADEEQRRLAVTAAVVDQDEVAQEVIAQDVIEGKGRPQIRTGLVRTAFNSLWREELSASDKQQVLAFALSPMLAGQTPVLSPLKDAHPGVQLAVVGDLNFALSEGQFSDLPLSSLEKLPAPFGPAFSELSKLGVKNMSELPARALAHLVVGNFSENAVPLFVGVENSEADFLARVLVIAPFADAYPALADELVRIMLGRDDRFSRRIEWFRADPGSQWVALPARDQVLCAIGMMPQTKLSLEQLADLLTFPAARVRSSAVELLNKEFTAKRIGGTLEFLASDQNRFTRPQVVLLMSALSLRQREPQNEAVGSFLATWFNTRPDPQSVLGLLASRREVEAGDPLSLESARFLSNKDWEASLQQLRDLVLHSEKLARALAYSRLDANLPDEAKLLEEGMKNESDPRLREQIQGKLKSAKILSGLPTPSPELLQPLPEEPSDTSAEDDEVLDSPL